MSHILTLNPTSPSESPAARNPQPSLRVVAIGGGTGLSALLRGLKRYVPAPAASGPVADPVPGPAFPPGPPADRRAQPAASPHRCLIHDLAAIVTVTDDGGSSGRLRRSEE